MNDNLAKTVVYLAFAGLMTIATFAFIGGQYRESVIDTLYRECLMSNERLAAISQDRIVLTNACYRK